MVVSINFFGMQRAVTNTAGLDMPITDETRVADALAYVRSQYPQLRLDEKGVLITVNHEMARADRVLRANDRVSFLPHIGGG